MSKRYSFGHVGQLCFRIFCGGIHRYSALTYDVMKSYFTRVRDKKIRNGCITCVRLLGTTSVVLIDLDLSSRFSLYASKGIPTEFINDLFCRRVKNQGFSFQQFLARKLLLVTAYQSEGACTAPKSNKCNKER